MERQMTKETKPPSESGKGNTEGLPLEDSPYLKYKDLEDYKLKGYGTQGHKEPKPGRGTGATNAPTLFGSHFSSQAEFAAAAAAHRKGVR